jgi:4-aminobutyrate--pyruvate transaminase
VELVANHGVKCARFAEEEGLIVRAIGDTIAFCPPLIISESEVKELLQRFTKALNRL